MTRFEISVEGEQLVQAQLALNAAGIPTIASGTDLGKSTEGRKGAGFFRSWGFVVLVVIVVAFFAQRLIDPNEEEAFTYSEFLTQVEEAPESIERVTLDPGDTSVEVDPVDGREYETGYPPETEDALINTLRRQQIETEVESTGGGGVLSLFAYVLPFLLFFAFWLLLMRRMERRQDEARASQPPTGLLVDSLKAVVEDESAEQAHERVRNALPDGSYRLGTPRVA